MDLHIIWSHHGRPGYLHFCLGRIEQIFHENYICFMFVNLSQKMLSTLCFRRESHKKLGCPSSVPIKKNTLVTRTGFGSSGGTLFVPIISSFPNTEKPSDANPYLISHEQHYTYFHWLTMLKSRTVHCFTAVETSKPGGMNTTKSHFDEDDSCKFKI